MTRVTAWRETTLGALEQESGGTIQTGPFGSQLHKSDYSAVGTPVVMPTNIRGLDVSTDGIARVSDEHVERLARHTLRAGDIVYSRRGDVEKCALITEKQEGWLCGTGCLLVRVQAPSVDARCLAYLLSLPETRAWISQHAVGATMPNLNTDILREVPVLLPSVEEQREIAATLGSFDDKIASNLRVQQLALELIQAQYQRIASAGGGRPATIGQFTHERRERVGKERMEEAVVLSAVSSGHLQPSDDYFSKRVYSASVEKYLMVSPGALAYNPARANIGSIGINKTSALGAVSPVYVVAEIDDEWRRWIETSLRSPRVRSQVQMLSSGSVRQTLKYADFASIQIPIPDQPRLTEFELLFGACEHLSSSVDSETRVLRQLRDSLLPELLSG